MSTVIYSSPLFGPVKSRRLGASLGINLLPADGKFCSFDCVYCECGLNATHRAHKPFPSLEEVLGALKERLEQMKAKKETLDALTFAGNGEPTLHPDFPAIALGVRALRDMYYPEAKVCLLSNGTQVHRIEVVSAMNNAIDKNIIKLDTVSLPYIYKVNRPGLYDVERQIEHLAAFKGNIIIQTMFMKGTLEGESVDNTSQDYVGPWLDALRRIAPQEVMIYTIARETPVATLEKASPEVLDAIGRQVEELGIEVSVSY